jgi:hypothetical protein
MNFYAINGEALNGSPVLPIAASADITCTVDVGAVATRVVLPTASLNSGTATFVATPTHTQAASADVALGVMLQTNVTFIQAASADLVCGAEIVAAVYRIVPCAVLMDCYADLLAIPASILADASITGTVALDASATKIQPGAAAMVGNDDVALAPFVTRNVAAAVIGTAAVRVEAQINNNIDAFADLVPSVDITTPDSGIVLRQAAAFVELQDSFAIVPTYVHLSTNALMDCYADVEPDGITLAVPASIIRPDISFTVEGVRYVLPAASLTVTASMALAMLQTHAGAALMAGDAGMALAPTLTQMPAIALDPGSDMTATGVAMRMVAADLQGNIDIAAGAINTMVGSAQFIDPGTDLQAAPTRICLATIDGTVTADFVALSTATRPAAADITGSAAIDGTTTVTRPASASFDVSVDFALYPVMKIMAACVLGVSIDLQVNARINIEAVDLPDDTMYRPADDTEFDRPFEETEMRRYA